ncbi:C4-dicarboxylate TRAP transporter substrate-binding protein [Pseudooceanicola sp.]|uniref:C4-dicarboxylate TRAP transporter substrate-binding protein n=1 Tax=Pseudooceanicola TaxID=1679449 RepID=UPI003514C6D8
MKTIATAAVAATLCLSALPARAIELTYGSYTSPTHTTNRLGIFPTMERIEADSNGEITFEPFTGGAMGGPKELLGNVSNSVLDSASVVDIYVKSSLPVSAMISSMMAIGGDHRVMAGAMNEMQLLNCPACEEERAANNVVGLSWSAISPVHIICRQEAGDLAGLQARKIMAPSGLGPLVQAIGMTPVSITTAEMYEALNRGQLDCAVGSRAWLDTYNLKDVAAEVMTVPLGSYFGVMNWTINRDVWDALSPGQQQAFKGNMAQNIGDIVWAYEADDEVAIKAFEENGGKVVDPGQAFVDAWAEQQEATVALTIEKGQADGIEDAEAIVTTFLGLVDKWTGIVADAEGSKEAYIKALQTEVFDKI